LSCQQLLSDRPCWLPFRILLRVWHQTTLQQLNPGYTLYIYRIYQKKWRFPACASGGGGGGKGGVGVVGTPPFLLTWPAWHVMTSWSCNGELLEYPGWSDHSSRYVTALYLYRWLLLLLGLTSCHIRIIICLCRTGAWQKTLLLVLRQPRA